MIFAEFIGVVARIMCKYPMESVHEDAKSILHHPSGSQNIWYLNILLLWVK